LLEQKRLLEDEIQRSDSDENENPNAYATNMYTVRRAIVNAFAVLKMMQQLCENHNPNT
jgi:hypothetical protein